MPKTRDHHFRFAGTKISDTPRVQRSAPDTVVLAFVCERCGEHRDYQYQKAEPIDAHGNTLKLRRFDVCPYSN